VDWLKDRLQVLLLRRFEILLQQVLVLLIQKLVLLGVSLNLSLEAFDVLLKLHNLEVLHIAVLLESLVFLA